MTQFYKKPFIYQERVSVTDLKEKKITHKGKQGSVTVEAAMTIPVFLFAVLSLVYLLEIQSIHLSAMSALQGAAEIAAEEIVTVPVLNTWKLKSDMVKIMGEDRLEQSIVKGGSSGIHVLGSRYDSGTGIIYAKVKYRVRLPFPGVVNIGIQKKAEVEVRAWTGYEKRGIQNEDNQIVYITTRGSVYHEDYHCRYLQPSIRYVSGTGVKQLRNKDGSKYYPCKECALSTSMGGVYITDYGTKYHSSLRCSGLKRTIRAVKKCECAGRHACSKCGK